MNRALFLILCLLLCNLAVAQQPIGNGIWICDGAAQAGPCQVGEDDDSASNGGSNSSGGYTDNDYEHAPARWADRWGAIADDGNGVFGIVESKTSKAQAQQAAINECKKRGGGKCEIQLAYYNQCAAVATTTTASYSSGSETAEKAKNRAMSRCNESGGQCWLYYSGCSLQERVQ